MEQPPSPSVPSRRTLETFLDHFSLAHRRSPGQRLLPGRETTGPRGLLEDVVRAFSRLPYENLTKIIKKSAAGSAWRARRLPEEVVRDHIARGTGGTCFSLTYALLDLLRSLGWRTEPILADRRYGENTHCALLVELDGETHLVDPGFLILRPVRLDRREPVRVDTGFNTVWLAPRAAGERLDLSTEQQGGRRYRLTFKTDPVEESRFIDAWEASFDWDMMRYPVLTRTTGAGQLYLQGHRLQRRDLEGVERRDLSPESLPARIAREFGIDRQVATEALRILERQGESSRAGER